SPNVGGITHYLNRIISGSLQKYLQEPIITQRSGRYVVPVKAAHKSEIKGIVHDSSASGATLFIEPATVVEANNRLRDLAGQEKEEIEKILRELTDRVAAIGPTLLLDYHTILILDVIFAKAAYSSSVRGSRPAMGSDSFVLKSARHPLIDPLKVVPISLTFGGSERTLVITGPNTGGKTVTLKTLGLMVYMAQSGIFPPCDDGTALPFMSSVLPDIGDEQSIEQSLSTFSAHMTNIVEILNTFDERSLVLFDELGAGTDPTEGAALAIAILEKVKSGGAFSAATTHYSELKLYALDTEGILNASCEFDIETLSPTYHLTVGIPGKSNAFAISSRLGLNGAVIERAKELLADDNIRFEEVITKLEATGQSLEKDKIAAEESRKRAASREKEAEESSRKMLERAEAELDRARQQAERILESAKQASRQVFAELDELKRSEAKKRDAERIEEARKSVQETISRSKEWLNSKDETAGPDEPYVLPRLPNPGETVILADIGREAVVKSVNGNTVLCIVGRTETRTPLTNIRLTDGPRKGAPAKRKGTSSYSISDAACKNEIDVRGFTGDDAWFAIDRWLEEVLLAGYSTVTVIHGKGTGALRSALWQFFKKDKRIASYRVGKYGEGETGVTILEIAK
ncbi:MAG: endonuclease MutS2, partial [Clostridia bacterium]|nr:endonuclease MutS2 [Clostridia bacterium]